MASRIKIFVDATEKVCIVRLCKLTIMKHDTAEEKVESKVEKINVLKVFSSTGPP